PPFGNGPTERCPDHLLRAPGPAPVFQWLLDRNRQIVAAGVTPRGCARWTTRPVIPPGFALHLDVVENPELFARIGEPSWGRRSLRCRRPKPPGNDHASGYLPQFRLADPLQARKIAKLRRQRVIGVIKPVPLSRSAMYAQRRSDRIAELSFR